MNTEKSIQGAVRRQLADYTRSSHVALHSHLWISGLLSDTLSLIHYQSVLEAYKVFIDQVEDQRNSGQFATTLSLQSAIHHLALDIRELSSGVGCKSEPDTLDIYKNFTCALPPLQTEEQALAALYVIHGSRFGSAMIGRRLKAALPSHSHHFFSNPTPKSQWQELISALDTAAGSSEQLQDLLVSADNTFCEFGRHVTDYCTWRACESNELACSSVSLDFH